MVYSSPAAVRGMAVAVVSVLALAGAVRAGGTGSVSGTVMAAGEPVAGARVTVFTQPQLFFFAETRTADDGSYVFKEVPVGRKILSVAAVGFDYEQTLIDVSLFPWVQDFSLAPESEIGVWEVVGDTLPEFLDATDIAILLPDGSVFYCHDTTDPIRFDPVTGTKTFPAGSGSPQGCMNGTLLDSGDMIMAGGQDGSDPGSFTCAIPWAKVYDTDADTWAQLEDMQHEAGRWYPGLARLADGSLLVMGGGQAPDAARTETCERFDPQTLTWSYTGSMLNPCEFPPSALLMTGEVLATWSPPQLYDPQSGAWSATGDFNQPKRGWPGHSDHSVVVLADGRVVAVGVRGGSVMTEIYDPATKSWSLGSSPELVRCQTEVVPLPDGRILVAGGETDDPDPPVDDVLGIVKWTDLHDPITDTWRRVADMSWFREYHAVTLLVPDGRVLTTGGTRIQFQFGPTSADIEAYSPPYLFRGIRPEIVAISSTSPKRGDELVLDIAPSTQITSVVLMGTESTTHWVSAGVPRRLVLSVRQVRSSVTATLPADPNVLPVGRYMVFAMVDDIPSVARIVHIRPRAGDVDGNGAVDFADLLAMLGAWGPCPASPATCPADVNGSGAVDFGDLLTVLTNWD